MAAWKPTITDGGGASADGAPPPRRRRRHTPTPLVDAAQQASPRVSTGARQPPGKRVPGVTREALRVQLGDRWSRIIMDVKAGEYTWQEFADGLDEEELARGQLRDSKGGFVGRPPVFVPREFLLACQREQKRRFEIIFGSEVLGIAQSYVELCKSKNIPEKDRAKMMQYAMERIFGGIPKDIRVSQEAPWEQMVVNVMSDGDTGMAAHRARRYAGYEERQGGGSGDDNV